MELNHRAISGATLAQKDGVTCICDRMISDLSTNAEYDYILFEGGWNDMWGNSLGTITEDFGVSPFNKSTTLGNLENLCYWMKLHIPNIPKLFILPHLTTESFVNSSQNTYWNGIIKVLAKWGIPFIDFRRESQLQGLNQELKDKWFYQSDGTHGDGTHPNTAAYATFYVDKIAKRLETLGSTLSTNNSFGQQYAIESPNYDRCNLMEREGIYYDRFTFKDSVIVTDDKEFVRNGITSKKIVLPNVDSYTNFDFVFPVDNIQESITILMHIDSKNKKSFQEATTPNVILMVSDTENFTNNKRKAINSSGLHTGWFWYKVSINDMNLSTGTLDTSKIKYAAIRFSASGATEGITFHINCLAVDMRTKPIFLINHDGLYTSDIEKMANLT